MTGSVMSSARLQGANPVMIAGVQDILDDRLVAASQYQIHGRSQMKTDRRFPLWFSLALALIYVLPRYGLSNRDVTLLQVGDTPERLVALAGGSIDAALISPPDHLEAQRAGMKILLNLHDSRRAFAVELSRRG